MSQEPLPIAIRLAGTPWTSDSLRRSAALVGSGYRLLPPRTFVTASTTAGIGGYGDSLDASIATGPSIAYPSAAG